MNLFNFSSATKSTDEKNKKFFHTDTQICNRMYTHLHHTLFHRATDEFTFYRYAHMAVYAIQRTIFKFTNNKMFTTQSCENCVISLSSFLLSAYEISLVSHGVTVAVIPFCRLFLFPSHSSALFSVYYEKMCA